MVPKRSSEKNTSCAVNVHQADQYYSRKQTIILLKTLKFLLQKEKKNVIPRAETAFEMTTSFAVDFAKDQ